MRKTRDRYETDRTQECDRQDRRRRQVGTNQGTARDLQETDRA